MTRVDFWLNQFFCLDGVLKLFVVVTTSKMLEHLLEGAYKELSLIREDILLPSDLRVEIPGS